MNLIRFHEPTTLSFRKSAGGSTTTYDAHRDFVIANAQLDRVMQDESVRNRVFKISRLDNMMVNFNAAVPKKPGRNRVLVYNGSGGYGDQIMTWPFTLILARMGYEVHVCTDPGNQALWWNLPWIKSLNVLPMPYEIFQMFEHYILMDTVVNMYEHSDQPHPLDCMLRKIGVDPAQVPDNMKVVSPNYTTSEVNAGLAWRDRLFGIYQLAGANPVRNLPAQDSVFLLSKLAQAYPKVTWLAVYDEFIPKDYVNLLLEDDIDPATKEPKKDDKGTVIKKVKYSNVIVHCAPNIRELWSITSHAKVVVAPDSLMCHVAGSQKVPCVGLWGAFNPQARMKYYANHHPIHNKDVCPHAPCNHYLSSFPKYCPPRQGRNVCEVMASIDPNQVIEAVAKIAPILVDNAPAVG